MDVFQAEHIVYFNTHHLIHISIRLNGEKATLSMQLIHSVISAKPIFSLLQNIPAGLSGVVYDAVLR